MMGRRAKILRTLVALAVDAAAAPPSAKAFPAAQVGADEDTLRATLARDALVVLPEGATTPDLPSDGPDGLLRARLVIPAAGATPGKVSSGRRGDATWIVADLRQRYQMLDRPAPLARCNPYRTLRLSELVVGGRVVALRVDDPRPTPSLSDEAPPLSGATEPGPRTALRADPRALAAALLDDPAVTVLGSAPSERATGPSASRRLLAGWGRLSPAIAGAPREVHGSGWAYAAAYLTWRAKDETYGLLATAFAIEIDGSWRVVAVHDSQAHERPS